jgi:ABC-2 type transport system permease protein
MLWYLMMTESILLSAPRVSMEIDEDVRTGRLSVQLLRPLSYVIARPRSFWASACAIQ